MDLISRLNIEDQRRDHIQFHKRESNSLAISRRDQMENFVRESIIRLKFEDLAPDMKIEKILHVIADGKTSVNEDDSIAYIDEHISLYLYVSCFVVNQFISMLNITCTQLCRLTACQAR